MSFEHTVWSLDEKKPLKSAELISEKELEDLIVSNIELLNDGWLVIGNQVKTKEGKFIDVLCMDHDGDLVVVELKKNLTPREVTAQVIDYAASVSKLKTDEISKIYNDNRAGEKSINDAYRDKFHSQLDEDNINQNVKMVIVAAQMDKETERIISYLRDTYSVDINILFFEVFECDGQRLISRAWYKEDIEEQLTPANSGKKEWNGEFYASFGIFEELRSWEDAVKYGFISAGGGKWYSRSLSMLSEGDRVWVNIPQKGYVGVGIVEEEARQAKDVSFMVEGVQKSMEELPLLGEYFFSEGDPEHAEYVVKMNWIKTVPENEAVKEYGFFGNQNSVCRPVTDKWNFTVDRLKKCWKIDN